MPKKPSELTFEGSSGRDFSEDRETTPTTLDVRIIAACNERMEELIKERQFREDLYYLLTQGIRL